MAHITVSDTTPTDQYTATGGQTQFTVSWPFFTDSSLKVYKTAAGAAFDETADLLSLSTNYTVTGAGNVAGVTRRITLTSGATAGDIITIVRAEPYERSADFQNNGDLLAETLNDEQDLEVMLMQQLKAVTDKSLQLSQFDSSNASVLLPVPEAYHLVRWNAAANALENVTGAEINETPSKLTLSNTDAVDLTDGNNVLNVSPTSGQHLAMDGDEIQSKANATTAGNMSINRLGGDVDVGPQSGTGQVCIYHNGAQSFCSAGDGFRVFASSGAANTSIYARDNGGEEIFIRKVNGGNTLIRSTEHGATVQIQAEDTGGTVRDCVVADPDAGTSLYYTGASRIQTTANGVSVNGDSIDLVTKPTVTGSRGGNAALASLLTALANIGLITDSTTA